MDARLRRFSGENRLNVDYRWNTSKMTRRGGGRRRAEQLGQGKPGYSPEWESALFWPVGVPRPSMKNREPCALAMSRRESDITRWNMGVDAKGQPAPGQDTYSDRIDNFLGKFSVRASADTTADLTLKYSDRSESAGQRPVPAYALGQQPCRARIERECGPLFPGRTAGAAGGLGSFAQQPGVRRRRAGDVSPYGLPLYTAGGFGKEQTRQDTWTLKAGSTWTRCARAYSTHIPYAGIETEPGTGELRALPGKPLAINAPTTATAAAGISARSATCPETVDVNYNMASLYLSDRIRWERLALDAGLRADRETFLPGRQCVATHAAGLGC